MWAEITKPVKRLAGAAGTLTFNSGARILQIIAIGGAGGQIVLPTGDGSTTQTIPLPAAVVWTLQENHTGFAMQGAGAQLQIVFTSTVSYYVEYQDNY